MRNSRSEKKHRRLSGLRLTAGIACLVLAGASADTLLAKGPNYAAQDIAVQDFGSMVTFTGGMSKSGGTLHVRIDGPGGDNVFEATTELGFVDWSVNSKMPSGNYKYDVWFTPLQPLNASHGQQSTESFAVEKAAEPGFQTQHQGGVFKVEGGVIVPQLDPDIDTGQNLSMNAGSPSVMERLAGAALDFLVPAAHAGTCATPCEVGTGESQVTLIPSSGSSWEFETATDGSQIRIGPNLGSQEMWRLEAGAPNFSFFMESTGDIGLGTGTPDTKLEIVDTFPNISLVDSNNANKDYELLNNGGIFFLIDRSTPSTPINVQGNTGGFLLSLNNDRVGVGNFVSPAKLLHVRGNDASQLAANNVMTRVENNAGTTASRRMLELVNNGSPLLVYHDTSSGETWSQNPVGGLFTITKGGTGQQEFQMDGGGNVTIQGSLTQNSMRSSKQGFGAVDADTVLAKLDQLAIEEWSYKHTPDSRHMSPMAEDFYATFGLGPKNGIAPTDLAGVALAAAKALKADNDAKDLRIAELEARMARLEAMIAD